MDSKLKGDISSLGMLTSYIKTGGYIKSNEKVIVIDAGGTNLRVSTLYFNDKKDVVIDNFYKTTMPGVNKETTKDQFYTEIAKAILPFNNYSNKVGFCFSYPVELDSSSDGTIINMCKEIKTIDVVGTKVCKNLNNKIVELGGDKKTFTLLNDSTAVTTCALTTSGYLEKLGKKAWVAALVINNKLPLFKKCLNPTVMSLLYNSSKSFKFSV